MNILTVENDVYNLDSVPDEIDDLRYCVLDVNDPEYFDYFWHPLVFLESFYSPAIVLSIGGNEIQMPMDWSIAICDDDCHSEIEIVPLTSLNNRGFKTPVFNPMDNILPLLTIKETCLEFLVTKAFDSSMYFLKFFLFIHEIVN